MTAPPSPSTRTWSMEGKTVVITGGNSGVGKATAVALGAAGARTVIAARSEARGGQALADIRRDSGSDLVDLVVFDLADLASIRDGAERITGKQREKGDKLMTLGRITSANWARRDGR